MNATRAATIRLRSSFDGAVSLGRVQTPTLAILARREEEIRAFVPEPYWLVDAAFDADGRAQLRGPLPRRREAAAGDRRGGRRRSSRPSAASRGEITKLEKTRAQGARAAALRPHVAAARGQHAASASPPAARSRAAQRCYEEHKALTYPRTSSRYLTSDMVAEIKPIAEHVGGRARVRATAPSTSRRSTCCRSARVVDDEKVGDHHAIIPTNSDARPRQDERRRPPHLRPGRAALPRRLPPRGRVREHARRDDGRRARLPHARQGPARAGLARRLRRARRGRRRGRRRRGPRPAAAEARAGRGGRHARGRAPRRRRPSRRGATPTPRCWARWRPPASSSTTTSCARR